MRHNHSIDKQASFLLIYVHRYFFIGFVQLAPYLLIHIHRYLLIGFKVQLEPDKCKLCLWNWCQSQFERNARAAPETSYHGAQR